MCYHKRLNRQINYYSDLMKYKDLRDFIQQMETLGQLKRIQHQIDPYLEMTEICDRSLKANGPAILFENPKNHTIPVLGNLFGSTQRVAYGMGAESSQALREIGQLLAQLKEPEPPKGIREAWDKLPLFKHLLNMSAKVVKSASCQQIILEKHEVDLSKLPIQTCWPGDAAPLITWALVTTKGPHKQRQNLGIYRQQVIDSNRVIMRWLAHRGGALDFRDWCKAYPGEKFPVAVSLGADPATILAAVTPIPDHISEYSFAGLLRGNKTELVKCLGSDLLVPASAEIVLEGYISPDDVAQEGPFGDHTGYYNEIETFPVFTIERITHRENPIYHSTYTGKPPDEPSVLGLALNEVFVPILQKQFDEIVDFYLPPEACSYRLAVISIKKQYPGHAKRVMFGIWSFLRQFMYTKFVIVVDDDINIRDWQEVIWALSTRVDPARDCTIIENTPIDYLDFASPVSGLGSKLGIDATNKWQAECNRNWGEVIVKDKHVSARIDAIWDDLGIFD